MIIPPIIVGSAGDGISGAPSDAGRKPANYYSDIPPMSGMIE
jgi:hypothetical protein